MSPSPFTPRLVNLSSADCDLIGGYAHARRLGPGGFNLALRLILHEWSRLRKAFEPIDEPATPDDVNLEIGRVEAGIPTSSSHPALTQDEYEAALARMRIDKFLNPPT